MIALLLAVMSQERLRLTMSWLEDHWQPWASRPFNLAANFASIFGLVATLFATWRWEVQFAPIAYLCLLSAFLVWRYLRHERWARYGEAQSRLCQALDRVRAASDASIFESQNPDLFIEHMKGGLDSFAAVLSQITGASCRVCLVDVEAPLGQDPVARVLLRNGMRPNEGFSSEQPQPISKNSDFLEIMSSLGERPFHNNNLPRAYRRRKYENSKFTPAMLTGDEDFPYRSAIVWPIGLRPREGPNDENLPMVFLCADAKQANAFDRCDVDLGTAFCHAMYPVVRTVFS